MHRTISHSVGGRSLLVCTTGDVTLHFYKNIIQLAQSTVKSYPNHIDTSAAYTTLHSLHCPSLLCLTRLQLSFC